MDLDQVVERAVVVGGGMIATVTEPLEAPLGRAVIMLNSGVLQRTGTGRLHVRIARELSAAGFHCMRMDFTGVGDSPRQPSTKTQYERWVEETLCAVDYVHNELETVDTVLLGNCSGGEIAVRAGTIDSRVREIVALNTEGTYKLEGTRQLSYFMRARLFSIPAWVSKVQQLLGVARGQTNQNVLIGYEPSLEEDDWRRLAEQEKRLLFGFSSYDPRSDLFKRRIEPIFRDAIAEKRCRVAIMRKADHLFTPEAAKVELLKELKRWLNPR
jgi:pimeloyl-ACP methyl ester carboxylesterase